MRSANGCGMAPVRFLHPNCDIGNNVKTVLLTVHVTAAISSLPLVASAAGILDSSTENQMS